MSVSSIKDILILTAGSEIFWFISKNEVTMCGLESWNFYTFIYFPFKLFTLDLTLRLLTTFFLFRFAIQTSLVTVLLAHLLTDTVLLVFLRLRKIFTKVLTHQGPILTLLYPSNTNTEFKKRKNEINTFVYTRTFKLLYA